MSRYDRDFTQTSCLGRIAAVAMLATALPWRRGSAAKAEDLIVKYDQSQLLRLPRPAAEIIIGNPAIADISVQSGNLLVITGKTFGITNIIALDADRNVIQDQRVLVKRDDLRRLSLYKGSKRESYTCTPDCAPTITVGDGVEYFDAISKSTQAKNTAASGAVDKGNQSSNE